MTRIVFFSASPSPRRIDYVLSASALITVCCLSADATISFYNGSNDHYIAKTIAVPADSTLVAISKDSMLYLEEGQSIRGGASANSDLSVLICYEILDDA